MSRFLAVFVTGLAGLLLLPALAFAQQRYYPPGQGPGPQRMSYNEASEITQYWYRSYLRRSASPKEIRNWAGFLMNAPSPGEVLADFLGSEEYFVNSGGNRPAFVRQLILDVGHHEPAGGEIAGWLQRTGQMSSRDVASVFLREFPANWWPGPQATPPNELRYLYGGNFGGPSPFRP